MHIHCKNAMYTDYSYKMSGYPYNAMVANPVTGVPSVPFRKGLIIESHSTHSNQQLAYGTPDVYSDEARILANTVMYVSQRQQCQVCQSGQDGNGELHFVHRIYTAQELAKTSDPAYAFTYPLDDCYRLRQTSPCQTTGSPLRVFGGISMLTITAVKADRPPITG